MSEPVRGIIHVHSNFSRDGLCSIADLADFARDSGYRFVGLTDHAEDLTPADMKELRLLCEKHSDDSLAMIPGLEYRCRGEIHILGLGITHDISTDDPVLVASQIRQRGGLAVLAHPGRSGYQCAPELCAALDGIEIWNAGYDGLFVPSLENFRLLGRARGVNSSLFGIGGADLHGFHRPPGVILELLINGSTRIDPRAILKHIGTGKFSIRGRYVRFSAYTVPHRLARVRLWVFRKLYEVSKAVRDVALGEN
ncbi:MAG: PHP domain-containing protein [Candidatus Methylomirabilales bacterium]